MKKLWKNIQTEDVCFIVLGTSFTKDPYTLLGKFFKVFIFYNKKFRSTEMIDFLLKTEEDDKKKMRDTMSEMIFCRDDNGLNVLATYFKTDLGRKLKL